MRQQDTISLELLRLLMPDDLCAYAEKNGWKPLLDKDGRRPFDGVSVYNSPVRQYEQIRILDATKMEGYEQAACDAISRLSDNLGISYDHVMAYAWKPGMDRLAEIAESAGWKMDDRFIISQEGRGSCMLFWNGKHEGRLLTIPMAITASDYPFALRHFVESVARCRRIEQENAEPLIPF